MKEKNFNEAYEDFTNILNDYLGKNIVTRSVTVSALGIIISNIIREYGAKNSSRKEFAKSFFEAIILTAIDENLEDEIEREKL